MQLLLKNMEKSGESSGSDTETNAVVSQVIITCRNQCCVTCMNFYE